MQKLQACSVSKSGQSNKMIKIKQTDIDWLLFGETALRDTSVTLREYLLGL